MSTVLVGIVAYVLFIGWICRRLKNAVDRLPRPSMPVLVRFESVKQTEDGYALTWH